MKSRCRELIRFKSIFKEPEIQIHKLQGPTVKKGESIKIITKKRRLVQVRSTLPLFFKQESLCPFRKYNVVNSCLLFRSAKCVYLCQPNNKQQTTVFPFPEKSEGALITSKIELQIKLLRKYSDILIGLTHKKNAFK